MSFFQSKGFKVGFYFEGAYMWMLESQSKIHVLEDLATWLFYQSYTDAMGYNFRIKICAFIVVCEGWKKGESENGWSGKSNFCISP